MLDSEIYFRRAFMAKFGGTHRPFKSSKLCFGPLKLSKNKEPVSFTTV